MTNSADQITYREFLYAEARQDVAYEKNDDRYSGMFEDFYENLIDIYYIKKCQKLGIDPFPS